MTVPAASSPIAELDDVSHIFGATAVLRHISLTLEASTLSLLLGENGAGKSTLLRVLAGLMRPRFGAVRLLGAGVFAARDQVGYMAHAPMLYEEFTAVENLRYFARLYQPAACLSPPDALASVGLDPGNPSPVRAYSQGMRQRVSLARALLARPRLLLLDEPFSNLDRPGALAMMALLGRERARGCALVLTTHQSELAEPMADRVLTLRSGALQEEPRR